MDLPYASKLDVSRITAKIGKKESDANCIQIERNRSAEEGGEIICPQLPAVGAVEGIFCPSGS